MSIRNAWIKQRCHFQVSWSTICVGAQWCVRVPGASHYHLMDCGYCAPRSFHSFLSSLGCHYTLNIPLCLNVCIRPMAYTRRTILSMNEKVVAMDCYLCYKCYRYKRKGADADEGQEHMMLLMKYPSYWLHVLYIFPYYILYIIIDENIFDII